MHACRTCLTKKDLNPLFGDLSEVRFTSKQLYLATGVSIRPNDSLPQLACKSCIKQIKESIDFRFISNKTNIYLQQILKSIKIKSETINSPNWSDDEDPDRFYESPEVFLEVKEVNNYLQDNDFDNNEIDNSHNDLDNKEVDDCQKKYNSNDKSQPDNEKKYLNNDRNSKSQSDNHKSQLDKQLSDNKNIRKHITSPKSQKPQRITRKTSKNMIKKKLPIRKSKSYVDLSQKINIKIEDYETDSQNSDISNKSSNKQKMSSKSNENVTINNQIQNVIPKESERNEVNICRQMSKQKRNNLMSLAVTPYPSDGPVQCRVCNEQVKLTSFVMHAKRHFAPEFTCEVCGKMFRSHAHMVYHQQRMHDKVKRLACSLCDFRTVDRLKLKNHERCHTGERPYVCDECGASFRMRTNILQHMRTHFGLRYIQCELCANLFRSKSELANHKNKVHNRMTYLCYLCPQTYKGKKAVRRHLMNLHGVVEEQILDIKCIKSKKFEEITKN